MRAAAVEGSALGSSELTVVVWTIIAKCPGKLWSCPLWAHRSPSGVPLFFLHVLFSVPGRVFSSRPLNAHHFLHVPNWMPRILGLHFPRVGMGHAAPDISQPAAGRLPGTPCPGRWLSALLLLKAWLRWVG